MNKSDRIIQRWALVSKYPALRDQSEFGKVEKEIQRLEDKGVQIRGSEPGLIGASVMQEGPVRLFNAACESIFYARPPDGINQDAAILDAILDPEVQNPEAHVRNAIEAQQKAIRELREKVKPSPEHERVINEDAELDRILSGHDEE